MFSSAIVWYLFLAGVGSGAFLVAAATMAASHYRTHYIPTRVHTGFESSFRNDSAQKSLRTTVFSRFGIELRQGLGPSQNHIRICGSLVVSTICIVAGALSLLATFNNPLGAWRVIFTPLASITSFGATVVMAFAILSILITGIILFKLRLPHWLFAVLAALGSITAFCTMLYAGFLLLLIISVDLWGTVLLPLLFIISSLTCGLAASLFIEAIYLGIHSSGFAFRWNALLCLTLAEALALAALLVERAGASPTALASVQLLLFQNEAWPFWLGVVALGVGFPLITHLLFVRLPLEALILVGAAGTLIGGFFIRYCIVNAGIVTPVLPLS